MFLAQLFAFELTERHPLGADRALTRQRYSRAWRTRTLRILAFTACGTLSYLESSPLHIENPRVAQVQPQPPSSIHTE